MIMPTEKLQVREIHGESDVQKLRHALGEVWGIGEVSVNAARGEVTFSYDERAGSLEDFRQAIRSSGFHIQTADRLPYSDS